MKKFLMCLIFLVGFAGISSAILVGSGFDNSKVVKTEIQEYLEITAEEQTMIDNEIATKLSNKNKNEIVYDVVLFETADKRGFYTQSRIDIMNQIMNDNDPTNNILSVHEYFDVLSYGQVSVYGNIYLFKDSKDLSNYEKSANFLVEQSTYTRAKIKAETKYCEHSNNNASMIVFPTYFTPAYNSRLWPHAYIDTSFISINYAQFNTETITHEALHNFELCDLYINDKVSQQSPVGMWDVSANEKNTPNNLMFNKELLGWVSSSSYLDAEETAIEEITHSGTYTLQPTASREGTRAYKFGRKEGDEKVYFMVEYRKPFMEVDKLTPTCLIVYRINENTYKKGNNNLGYEDWQIYIFRPSEKQSELNCPLVSGSRCGGLSNINYALYYNDKSIAKHAIQNINFLEDGTCTFDYRNYENASVVAGVVNNENGKPINCAKVFLDGIERATTNDKGEFMLENVYSSGVISVEHTGRIWDFKPITVQPNTYFMTIYPTIQKSVSVSFSGYSTNETAKLYHYVNNEWVFVKDISTSKATTITDSMLGERYKVEGLDLINNEFMVKPNYNNYILTKKPPKVPENKTIIEKAINKITDFPGQVADAVSGAIDTIVSSVQSGVEAIKRGFSSFVDGIGGLFR